MKYHITAKTIKGAILTFKDVKDYSIEDGLIKFIDSKTYKQFIFPIQNIELQESD